MRRAAWIVMANACLGGAACLLVKDLDALSNGATDASSPAPDAPTVTEPAEAGRPDGSTPIVDAGATDASTGATCKGTAGPTPVPLPSPLDYCIDSTEVTVTQYAEFLAAKNGDVGGQAARCAGNTTYIPLFGQPGGADGPTPIRYVDLCDAVAYCTWAGKRVCGARGGGPVGQADHANAQKSEWYAACSHNADGVHPYPYGVDWSPAACDDVAGVSARDGGSVYSAAGSLPTCEGSYAGVFDMSGNVGEWEDGCFETDAGLSCPARGGSYYHDNPYSLSCAGGEYADILSTTPGLGIRCCSDRN